MQSNYLITATKCPKCKKEAVFPYTFLTRINDMDCGIISVKCDNCGWKEDRDKARERWIKHLVEG